MKTSAFAGAVSMRAIVGLKIRTLRKRRNLRLFDLAAATGFSLPKLCRMEFGLDPARLDDIATVARAFNVPVRRLLP